MTDLQRLQRAAFVREQPLLWFALLYAVAFLGCAVAHDVLVISGAAGLSPFSRYLLPLVVALLAWLGLRGWSRRVVGGTLHRPFA
jgi:hypothetical protein